MLITIATFEHLPIRVGGLSEAATSLGEALVRQGQEVMVILPSHGLHLKGELFPTKPVTRFSVNLGGRLFPTTVYEGSREKVKVFLLSNEILDREAVYGPDHELYQKVAHFAKSVPSFLNYYIGQHERKPDVFHSNDWHAVLAAEYVKKYFRIPYAYTIHRLCSPRVPVDLLTGEGLSDLLQPQFINNGHYEIEPAGAQGCKVLNTVSLTYLEEEWNNFFGHYEGKATYVWNGIDASFWDPKKLNDPKLTRTERKKKLLTSNGLDDGLLYFYVGRLDLEQKGVDHFLHAIDKVMSNGAAQKEHYRFVILGSGDKRLEDHIRHLEQKYPGNIKGIIGYLEREVTREYYASADFCVIPSNFEPFGLVQLEAMCLGSIPIGSKVGGINDTVVDAVADPERATGRLVPPRNPEALAQAIQEVAAWINKPDWMEKLRKNGRQNATKNFTWDEAARRYLQLYQDQAPMKISFAEYPKAF